MKFINEAVGKEDNGLQSFQEELKLRMYMLNSFMWERFSFIFSNQQGYKAQYTIYNRKLKVRHLFSDKGGQKYKTLVASKANSFLPCLVISTLHPVRSVSSGPKVYKLQQDM